MNDPELLNIFRVEVEEYLQALNNGLLQAEMIPPDDPSYKIHIREMNRVAHSMKGAARAVSIGVIESIAHYMEEVFDAVMKSGLDLSPDVADTIYDGLDLIQSVVDGREHDPDLLAMVIQNLEKIVSGTLKADATSDSRQMQAVHVVRPEDADESILTSDHPEADRAPAAPATTSPRRGDIHPAAATGQFSQTDLSTLVMRPVEETVRVTVSKLDRLMAESTELLVARMHSEEQAQAIADLRRSLSRWQREWRTVRTAYIRLVRRFQDDSREANAELLQLLRFLENNQRYLADNHRQLTELAGQVASHNTQLATLADQFQDDISGMRMMPFESIVGLFQRMLRDLARDMGKNIQLDIIGAGVEIDKMVLESLKDPLTHLLRNAVDHGIETPEARMLAGKSPSGHIQISVEQRGSEIVLKVSDDGRGIDPQRVRRSIVNNRLMNDTEAAALSDEEVRLYIFHPGLSTSDRVTALSGRGLGMDIVRDRVESLRGRVGVQSVLGEGTTVIMNVPVSLTRIRCILLRVGDQQFGVPSAVVLRMEQIARDSIFTAEGRDMIMLNHRPVPVASLGAVLDVASVQSAGDTLRIVALQGTDRVVAFEVDHLVSEQELVLKPLGPELARAPFVAGAALLGSGNVIIILDANDLVRRAMGAPLARRRTQTLIAAALPQRRMRVLVVDDSITTRTLEKNILETAGFDVMVAINGLEAWQMITEEPFDVVISDVEMPLMNGLELTERIKTSAYRQTPVILLTSLGKPEQREAGLRAGADGYLIKSRFDQAELLQTIYSVVVSAP
jgi:two-component system chemotaxis sensor kinase CheA